MGFLRAGEPAALASAVNAARRPRADLLPRMPSTDRLLRCQRANHAAAVVSGQGLDLRDIVQLREDVVDHLAAFFDVGQLSAAEHHCNDHFVLVFEKLPALATFTWMS